MKSIDGIRVDLEYLPEFEWVEDIQYYDGTLTAEYRSKSGDVFVFHWCDCTNELNRWLAVRVNRRSLYELTSGLISLRDFFEQRLLDRNVYILDINLNENIQSAYIVHMAQVAEDYLPEQGVFISTELLPDKEYTNYPVFIDKHWSDKELSEFPRKFMDAYSLIHKYVSKEETDRDNILTLYPWKGGYSSTAFYSTLRNKLKRILGIDAIQYASPGYIYFSANRDIALLVKKNVDLYIDNKEEIDEVFSGISNYLSKNNLNDKHAKLNHEQEKWLEHKCAKLMQYYSEPSWQWVLSNTPDVFRAAKVSMSYYRRIKPLSIYVKANMAVFGKL